MTVAIAWARFAVAIRPIPCCITLANSTYAHANAIRFNTVIWARLPVSNINHVAGNVGIVVEITQPLDAQWVGRCGRLREVNFDFILSNREWFNETESQELNNNTSTLVNRRYIQCGNNVIEAFGNVPVRRGNTVDKYTLTGLIDNSSRNFVRWAEENSSLYIDLELKSVQTHKRRKHATETIAPKVHLNHITVVLRGSVRDQTAQLVV